LTASLAGQTPNIDDFFRDFTATWVRGNPNLATSARYFTGDEQDRLERQLTPLTVVYRRARIQLAKQGLAQLQMFDRGKLTATQRISADLMQWQLDTMVREEPYLDYTFPLEQMNGANVGLIESLTVRHPLANEKDAENYVAALRQVSTRMDEATAEARTLAAKNIIPPKFILNATIKQMQGFADPSPGQNPCVAIFAQKMEAAKIPATRREALRSEAEKIVGVEIYPVWKNAIATLESQLPRSTDDAGLWRLKGGGDAYAYFLHRYTTTNLTPEQIHQVGLNEVARIEKEMDAIFRRLGRTEGSINERSEKLKQDLAYPRTEEGRMAIMAEADSILRDAEKRAAVLFDKTPKSRVVVQAFPRFREANAAANYNSPAPDGSRPGVIQIPLRPEMMTKFALRSLVYHEGVPGHHFQIALAQQQTDVPTFRTVIPFTAYLEGWALYAEWLGIELGVYKDDPYGDLGRLRDEMFRAVRLVVDTGIHYKRWPREQAIAYMADKTGMASASVVSEVERYIVDPGQACSYKIGMLSIQAARKRSHDALGARFDADALKAFHDVVLGSGALPLEVLDEQVDAWIVKHR
jgi:uncharacterized protein (DUF885 family)